MDISEAFSDPDGNDLTYKVASDAPDVASASVSGREVTVIGVAPGTAAVTVTAANRAPTVSAQVADQSVEEAAEVQ